MIQQNIRDYNDQTYSIEEGAAMVTELNARTSHNEDGYNSIAELGAKLKAIAGLNIVLIENQPFIWLPLTTNTEGVPASGDVAMGRIGETYYELQFSGGDAAQLSSWRTVRKRALSGGAPDLFVNGIVIGQFTSDPTGADSGQLYYNTTNNVMRVYNGATWGYLGANTQNQSYTITANTSAIALWNNALLKVKANATITLADNMPINYTFVGRVYEGVDVTFIAGNNVTISNESDGTSMTGKGMFTVFQDAANNYVICGDF